MAPSVTWNTKRIFVTYRNLLTGSKEVGTWEAVASGRIVNTLADGTRQIFRPGRVGSGSLNLTDGTPSLDFQLPIVDDPDNTPQGGEIVLTITFTSGGSAEVFHLSPTHTWPDAGTDLADIVDPTAIPTAPPLEMVGVAGGLAQLDSDGDVINASGTKILSGGGGGSGTTITFVDRGTWAAATAYALGSVVTYSGQRWLASTAISAASTFGFTGWIALGSTPDTF